MRSPESLLTASELLDTLKILSPEVEMSILIAMQRAMENVIKLRRAHEDVSGSHPDYKKDAVAYREQLSQDVFRNIVDVAVLMKSVGLDMNQKRLSHFLGTTVSLWPLESRLSSNGKAGSDIGMDHRIIRDRAAELCVLTHGIQIDNAIRTKAHVLLSRISNLFCFSKK
jgi:hypothetical protein